MLHIARSGILLDCMLHSFKILTRGKNCADLVLVMNALREVCWHKLSYAGIGSEKFGNLCLVPFRHG